MQNHPKNARALVALAFLLPLAVCAGIAKMDSKPVWDLADHGGMDVVDKIAHVKTGRVGYFNDVPVEPIVIKSVKIAE